MKSPIKKSWLAMLAVVLIGTTFAFNQSSQAGQMPGNNTATGNQVPTRPMPGFKAPDFTLVDNNGHSVKLSDLRGKKLFINFWASWCPPCKAETPDLVAVSQKYKGQVEFYGVNMTTSDSVESAKAFIQQYGIKFPILFDQNGDVAQKYQVISIPSSFTVDQNGIIVDRRVGQMTGAAMEDSIARLLGR